ncbi:MAG: GTPase Era [Bacteroidia bacterium]|jgi:GTP-binding protein Era|nr:GTPase Era [Bacteroidia bacterium]
MTHKAGFVSIIGKPNAGKSTLMNGLVGEKISIITPKVQTTRHRIMGILTQPEYQIVFSDTPGIIEPKYKLHGSMMEFVNQSLQDADLVIYITDALDGLNGSEDILNRVKLIQQPVIVLINKIDLVPDQAKVAEIIEAYQQAIQPYAIIPVSALNKFGLDFTLKTIIDKLPEGENFYPEDQLTDKNDRFIAAEIIREKILMRYKEEIPYSVQVEVNEFKEEPHIIRISSEIYVMRETQKQIVIGKGGLALKKVGMAARRDMETFFGKQVFLQMFVKVKENWRDNDRLLKQFGYKEQ